MKTYLTGLCKAFKKVFNRCYLRVGMVCVPGLLVLAVNRLFFAKNLLLFWSGLKKAPERGLFGSVFWGNQWFVQGFTFVPDTQLKILNKYVNIDI